MYTVDLENRHPGMHSVYCQGEQKPEDSWTKSIKQIVKSPFANQELSCHVCTRKSYKNMLMLSSMFIQHICVIAGMKETK